MPASTGSTRPTASRDPACWAHARRKFSDLARIKKAPIAIEAVERIDALFAIEREINGVTPQERMRVRNERSRSLVIDLERWLREQRARVSKNSETGKAINYSLKRWSALAASSMTGAYACPTTPPSASCVPSRSGAATGPSLALTKVAAGRLLSTRSSRPRGSTISIRRPGSPTSLPGCQIIPPSASTSLCLGNWRPQNIAAEAA